MADISQQTDLFAEYRDTPAPRTPDAPSVSDNPQTLRFSRKTLQFEPTALEAGRPLTREEVLAAQDLKEKLSREESFRAIAAPSAPSTPSNDFQLDMFAPATHPVIKEERAALTRVDFLPAPFLHKVRALEKAGLAEGEFTVESAQWLDKLITNPQIVQEKLRFPETEREPIATENQHSLFSRMEASLPSASRHSPLWQELEATKAVADLFSLPVAVIRLADHSPFAFNAANFDGAVWINENASRPLHHLFGHETLHQMKSDKPDLYENLKTAMEPMLGNRQAYISSYNLSNKTSSYIEEEMVADIFSNNFSEKAFWSDLAKTMRSKFPQTADYVCASIAKVEKSLENLAPAPGAPHLPIFKDDIQTARDIILNTVAEYLVFRESERHKSEKSQRLFSQAGVKSGT